METGGGAWVEEVGHMGHDLGDYILSPVLLWLSGSFPLYLLAVMR